MKNSQSTLMEDTRNQTKDHKSQQPTGEVTSTNFVSAKTPVLLQTAPSNHPTSRRTKEYCKGESYSRQWKPTLLHYQSSKNQLKLPTEGTETMLIKTFGSEEEKVQTY